MNRMVGLALRLYPAWWRRRYGSELQALIEDSGETWGTVFDLAKGAMTMRVVTVFSGLDSPRAAVACGLLGAGTAALVFFMTPTHYASTSTIEIQASDQATATSPAAVVAHAFNDTNLDSLVQRLGLYPSDQSRGPDAIRRLRADIAVELTEPETAVRTEPIVDGQRFRDQGALHISFRHPDERKAQALVAELTRLVINENLMQPSLARYRVTGLPHQVAAGSNPMTAAALGLAAGVLGWIGVVTLRRRVHASKGR